MEANGGLKRSPPRARTHALGKRVRPAGAGAGLSRTPAACAESPGRARPPPPCGPSSARGRVRKWTAKMAASQAGAATTCSCPLTPAHPAAHLGQGWSPKGGNPAA